MGRKDYVFGIPGAKIVIGIRIQNWHLLGLLGTNEYHMVTVFLEPAFGDRRAVRHNAAGQTHCTHVCPQPYYHSCNTRLIYIYKTCVSIHT